MNKDDQKVTQENPETPKHAEKRSKKIFAKPEKHAKQDEKIAELTADLQRTRADFENYRRQSEIQKEHYAMLIKLATVKQILPLLDDIERAINTQPEVMEPLMKNFSKTVQSIGLTTIDTSVGTAFNPELHEAVLVEGEGENESISETLRTGYYYNNEVLRPALVKVQKQ